MTRQQTWIDKPRPTHVGGILLVFCDHWSLSSHLWSSRGPSSWDHSCRFPCLPGKLRVQSTGPCRRPGGSHILAHPSLQSSGTLPGHTPLGLSTSGPGSPLQKGFKETVLDTVRLLFPPAANTVFPSLRVSLSSDNCQPVFSFLFFFKKKTAQRKTIKKHRNEMHFL